MVIGTGSLDDHDMQLLDSMDSLLGMDPGDDLEQELSALLPSMPLDGMISGGGILGGSNILHGGRISDDTRYG